MSCYARSSTWNPYTFADDLAEAIAEENDRRTAGDVLLATIDATADEKLTRFAIRLSGHVGIPRENERDFLAEAEAVLAPQQNKAEARKIRNVPASGQAQKPTEEAPAS